MKTILSKTSEDTFNLGRELGKKASGSLSISLDGDLGSGKTTFTQGLAKGLGVSDKYIITSPTFTLINEYPAAPFTLYHLDLYRLGSYDELSHIGFDELLGDNSIIVVEWPQILKENDFPFDLDIGFQFDADYNRIITVTGAHF
jgi:tRNA threonylcarbamoyladenosine biosynthesis protein TsaE